MEETTVSIVGIIIGAILMFIVPLVLIADRSDDISQLTVQTKTAAFVNTAIRTGKITSTDYQNYILALATTGNTYDIDIELKILDHNLNQQTVTNSYGMKIGENSYYSIFTSQIEEKLEISDLEDDNMLNDSGKIILKEGDVVSVVARNSSKTLSQSLKNIYYTIKDEDLHIIAGTASGTIAINGAT